jgi:mannose-6-phosphate isomerase-like protein (cupin superfamily)
MQGLFYIWYYKCDIKFNLKNMKGYITNIEKETIENENYRKVLYTAKNSQLVVMSIQPGDEIGMEVHDLDQFIRLEEGKAKVILDDAEHTIEDDWAVVIPAGTNHNVINVGDVPLKLYSIYSPAEHKDGTIHRTKADEKEEHFDGVTTE